MKVMKKINFSNDKLLMNIISFGSTTLLNAVLVFIVGIVTRNLLGPEQYGYWLTVSLIFTFIPIFQLGTLNAMNREVPFYLAKKDLKMVQKIRENVFSFIFTIPLLLVLCLCIISGVLFITDIRIEYKLGLLLASLIAGFTYLSGYAEMYYKSEQNFNKVSKLISIKSISQSIITIVLVIFLGYLGLYFGMLISLLIEIIMAKGVFPKKNRFHSFSEYKKLIQIGFPILVVGIVWSIMIATDRIIISVFMTPEDLGNYGVGLLVFSAIMLFPQVLSQIFYPKIVGLVSLGDFTEIKRIYWRVNLILAVAMSIVVAIGYFLLPYFIRWFMPEYLEGIKAAQILLIGIYPLTLVNIAANYFNSTDNQKIYLFIQVISVFLNVLLSIILLGIHQSIESVALATSISFLIYSILMNTIFIVELKKKVRN
jgi:O-antigen/teichoic acid export membrane protein